ncbi:hypothetical protein E0Z10_g8062 [Xylaria hypoxylon]|uniref:Uncharacterized protein n=1 Tax=Xylaria hypoxylon TaxID=37992 RepID=A0A4Z0YT97_9PEZI|nr:hypothetical protein E0Z10_g8062 [Xylaria hypoxylon]
MYEREPAAILKLARLVSITTSSLPLYSTMRAAHVTDDQSSSPGMTMEKSLDMAQVNRTDRTIPTDLRVGLEVHHPENGLVALHQTAIAMYPTESLDVVREAPTVIDESPHETEEI